MAADRAQELLPADATPGVQVELVEQIFYDETRVANFAPHLLQHIRLSETSHTKINKKLRYLAALLLRCFLTPPLLPLLILVRCVF